MESLEQGLVASPDLLEDELTITGVTRTSDIVGAAVNITIGLKFTTNAVPADGKVWVNFPEELV